MRDDTQTMDVLKHLKRYGSITSKKAIDRYGATRLSAIIYRLRYKYQYEIETCMITVKNRRGKDTNVAKYVLIGGQENE